MKQALLALALVMASHAHADPPRERLELPNQTLTDGTRIPLTPITIQQTPDRDSRSTMIGGGIVVLAAIFWWNRKRREQFDRTDARDATPDSRDDDSDDLQAAARGDNKDDE